jgi:hypothetical protein
MKGFREIYASDLKSCSLKNEMDSQGYLLIRGLLPSDDLNRLLGEITQILYAAGWLLPDISPLERMADVAAACGDPDPSFKRVNEQVFNLESFHALAHHPALRQVMNLLVGPQLLIHPKPIGRLIFPNCERFVIRAHQDHRAIAGDPEGFTAWIPLHDCPPELGPLQILEASHRFGLQSTDPGTGCMPKETACGDDWVGGKINAGDVLIFHSLTVHAASPNTSNQLRISMDCRFQDYGRALNPSILAFAGFSAVVTTSLFLATCSHPPSSASDSRNTGATLQVAAEIAAPPAATTGGFDGARAYKHVEQLVAIGPHSPGTDGIHRAQAYIIEQLKSFGCTVEEQDFVASTPIGDVAMKNIIAKIPSANPNIILYATHYDSKRLANLVDADDGSSSTGVILELARLLCTRKNSVTVWLVFFDGEKAFNFNRSDLDSTYGSRELAASLALSGNLQHVMAMILADMVGPANPVFKRELMSTPWLTDLIWSTAARLGYGNVFVNAGTSIEVDHLPFLHRDISASDVFDLEIPCWHTTRDTVDKIDPRSLAITGHVLLETLPELEKNFR